MCSSVLLHHSEPDKSFLMTQFYQQLAYGEIDEQYLWQQRLEPQLSYLSEDHRTKVREALSLGYDAHIKQKRKSGEPFITHPVEVTRILAELQMDHESLIAGERSLALMPDALGQSELNPSSIAAINPCCSELQSQGVHGLF